MTTDPASGGPRQAWATLLTCGAALALLAACKGDLDLGENPPGPCVDAGTACEVDGETACVDLATDPSHCGSCDQVCASGLCAAGECCEGQMPRVCGGACVDVATDPDHCSDCDVSCPSGLCAGGACCGAEEVACTDEQGAGACVDPATDPAHCGACDHACTSGLCSAGRCCEEAEGTVCEDAEGTPQCVDLVTDGLHCGQCGRACACFLGECCEQACGKQCIGPYGEPATAFGPEETRAARLADLDGDGYDDLVAPNQLSGSVSIYWGNTDGLGVAQVLEETGRVGSGLTVGDLDEDGFVDILSAVQSHGPPTSDVILVLHGDADRTFERRDSIDEPTNPILMCLLHADADEHLDLVMRVPGSADWKTAVRLGDGLGGLGEREDLLDYGTLAENDSIVGADIDGDGRDELVELRNASPNEIRIHHFDDDGHVDAARDETRTLPDGAPAYALALYDTDRDERRLANIVAFELVLEDNVWTGWRVFGLTEQGTCELAHVPLESPFIGGVQWGEYVLGIGDFDGNGLLDLSGFATCAYCLSVHFLHFGSV